MAMVTMSTASSASDIRTVKRTYQKGFLNVQRNFDLLFREKEEVIEMINAQINKIADESRTVLSMSKSQFLSNYEGINRKLNTWIDKLLMIKVKLCDEELDEEDEVDEQGIAGNFNGASNDTNDQLIDLNTILAKNAIASGDCKLNAINCTSLPDDQLLNKVPIRSLRRSSEVESLINHNGDSRDVFVSQEVHSRNSNYNNSQQMPAAVDATSCSIKSSTNAVSKAIVNDLIDFKSRSVTHNETTFSLDCNLRPNELACSSPAALVSDEKLTFPYSERAWSTTYTTENVDEQQERQQQQLSKNISSSNTDNSVTKKLSTTAVASSCSSSAIISSFSNGFSLENDDNNNNKSNADDKELRSQSTNNCNANSSNSNHSSVSTDHFQTASSSDVYFSQDDENNQLIKVNEFNFPQSKLSLTKPPAVLKPILYVDNNKTPEPASVKIEQEFLLPIHIVHIESITKFWVQPYQKEANELLKLIQDYQYHLLNLNINSEYLVKNFLHEGLLCAARYSIDNHWYRAKILSFEYNDSLRKNIETIKVFYIDYGNIEMVTKDRVMPLHVDLLQHKKQALCCSLTPQSKNFQINDDGTNNYWGKEAEAEFSDIVNSLPLEAIFHKPYFFKTSKISERVISDDNIVYPIDLFMQNNSTIENILNYLTPKELAMLSFETTPLTSYTTTITQSTSPSDASPASSPSSTLTNTSVKTAVSSASSSKTIVPMTSSLPPLPSSTKAKSANSNNVNENKNFIFKKEDKSYLSKQIPSSVLQDSEYLLCVVSHIVSPSEFYVHVITKGDNDCSLIDDIHEQMRASYANSNELFDQEIYSLNDYLNTYWACIYSSDKCWYRATVTEIMPEDDVNYDNDVELIKNCQVRVRYIDYGNEEIVRISDLRKLKPEFLKTAALARRCSLAYVKPAGDYWSDQCLRRFKNLSGIVKERTVTAYITNRITKNGLDNELLEVLLWNIDESDSENNDQNRDLLINSVLVKDHLAITDTYAWIEEADRANRERTPPDVALPLIAAKANDSKANTNMNQKNHKPIESESDTDDDEDEDGGDFNPLADDYFSHRNQYGYNQDNAGIATVGYQAGILKSHCKKFWTPEGCPFGNRCIFKHIPKEDLDYLEKDEELLEAYHSQDIPLQQPLLVKVTDVKSPSSFHIRFLKGYQTINVDEIVKELESNPRDHEIERLYDEMNKFYSSRKAIENFDTLPSLGSLVAFKKNETFRRGRVIEFNDRNDDVFLKIKCIDTGITYDNVKRLHVFKLKMKFAVIKPLSLQCSLICIQPIEVNGSRAWSEIAIQTFRNSTLEKNFIAYFHSINEYGIADCELIGLVGGKELMVSEELVEKQLADLVVDFDNDDAEEEPNYDNKKIILDKEIPTVMKNKNYGVDEASEKSFVWDSDEDAN